MEGLGFGERLEAIRDSHQMTIKAMAASMGVSAPTWRSYEREQTHPLLVTQEEFCRTYNVNPKWLFTGEGDPHGFDEEKWRDFC